MIRGLIADHPYTKKPAGTRRVFVTVGLWRGPATRFIWSSAGPQRRYHPGENRRVPRNTPNVPPQWPAVSANHSGLSMLSRGRGRAC